MLIKGAICEKSRFLRLRFGIGRRVSSNPRASLFEELGMRLKNLLLLQIAPLTVSDYFLVWVPFRKYLQGILSSAAVSLFPFCLNSMF